MNICYLGPLRDHSGYGEANRHAVAALDAAGINVVAKNVRYTMDNSDFGTIGQIVARLLENEADYRVKILHTTPDQYPKFMEKGKYHIGHFFWETTIVPEGFADGLKLMDEIWTGSQANVEAIRAAGVTIPVFVFPQAIETHREPVEPYELPGFDGFLFYSIFEWTDRKNPKALLEAYWREFGADEPVGLLLKTYFRNFTYANKRMIREEIAKLKDRLGLQKTPPVYIYTELMDRRQVQRVHATGDCFVSAHRGEGWGIPQVEAMLSGNPIISTNYGGVHEYLDDHENAMLVPAHMEPVRGMEHSTQWYGGNQKWAEIDPEALRANMRWAFENKQKSADLGQKAREFVENSLNLQTVGDLMANRLAEIEGTL